MHRIKNIKPSLVFRCQEMGTLDLTQQEIFFFFKKLQNEITEAHISI